MKLLPGRRRRTTQGEIVHKYDTVLSEEGQPRRIERVEGERQQRVGIRLLPQPTSILSVPQHQGRRRVQGGQEVVRRSLYAHPVHVGNWFTGLHAALGADDRVRHVPDKDPAVGVGRGQPQAVRTAQIVAVVLTCPPHLDHLPALVVKYLYHLNGGGIHYHDAAVAAVGQHALPAPVERTLVHTV